MAAILLGLSGFSIWSSAATSDAATSAAASTDRSTEFQAAQLAFGGEESLAREYLYAPTPDVKRTFGLLAQQVQTSVQAVETRDEPVDRAALDAILSDHSAFRQGNAEVFAAVDRGDVAAAVARHAELDPIFDRIRTGFSTQAGEEMSRADAANASLVKLQNRLTMVTAPAFGAGLLLLGVLGWIVVGYRRNLEQRTLELRHHAFHDALTGLPNRALFADRGMQAIAAANRLTNGVSVLLLDLDGFKNVNETLGHDQGDELLRQAASRLTAVLRVSDTVARLGGDEFTLLLPDVADEAVAVMVAEKVAAALNESFVLSGVCLDLEVSVGIAIFPAHGRDIETLLSRADIAMYESKREHRTATVYDSDRDKAAGRSLSLLGDLRRAIDSGDLVLHYQPKADLSTGQVTGVEALVRWQHADVGLIPPDDFLPLAERTGLIYPLTRYVLEHALAQCRTWMDGGRELQVAVNISTRNLLDPAFLGLVDDLLHQFDVPARLLQLELTENAIMADPLRARESIQGLARLGVSVSIDDFGTGYSSLACIQDLPVAELKIDRSFVKDFRSRKSSRMIVGSIVGLGQSLGLRVVAEGVEDDLVLQKLTELGCDEAQGYGLGRPMPAAELAKWIAEHSVGGVILATQASPEVAMHLVRAV